MSAHYIARANRPLREVLGRLGLREKLGEVDMMYFPSVHAAVEAFRREAGAPGPEVSPATENSP